MALSFPTVSDGLDLPLAEGLGAAATWTFLTWFKMNTNGATAQLYMEQAAFNEQIALFMYTGVNRGKLGVTLRSAGQTITGMSTSAWDDNIWHYLQLVKTAVGEYALYVDGTSEWSVTGGAAVGTWTVLERRLGLSVDSEGGGNPWTGKLNRTIAYTTAKTVPQGTAILNTGAVGTTPVFWYEMEGGVTEGDYSGKGFYGIVVGAPSATTDNPAAPFVPYALPAVLPTGLVTRYGSNPLVPQGGAGAFDETKTGCRYIIKMGAGDYRMWYEGVDASNASQVGYATSPDGLIWTKYGSNPVMTHERADENAEVAPKTVLYEGGVFKMWYHGGGPTGRHIYYATSPDGITWTKQGDPVLAASTVPGEWDYQNVAEPAVLHVGSTYYMYYMGWPIGGNAGIGLATSPDGIVWTKYGSNPVFAGCTAAGRFDSSSVWGAHVIRENGYWHMWYSGSPTADQGVGYAYSTDGLTWKRGPHNPVWAANGVSPEGTIGDTVTAIADGLNYIIMATGYYASPRVEAICRATVGRIIPSAVVLTRNVLGGPAQPAAIVTGRSVQGGPALPVYGYVAVPTDRPAMGGSALPVVVITDADLAENGGSYHVAGGNAIPIYTVDSETPVQGGPAIPVYVVNKNGWP